MSRPSPSRPSSGDRSGLYQEITFKIIAELEAGRVPWIQPWGTSAVKAPLAMPANATTRRRYSGVNVLILWGAVVQHGFSGQSWLTFRQTLPLGGNVRKGEHGTTVVFADRFIPDQERARARERGDEPNPIPFLKRFVVFNTDQCDGLPEAVATMAPPPPEGTILPDVETLIRASNADLRIGGGQAYYDVTGDIIRVPPPQAYFEPVNWHRTALHELGHNADVRIMPAGSEFPLEQSAKATRLAGINRRRCLMAASSRSVEAGHSDCDATGQLGFATPWASRHSGASIVSRRSCSCLPQSPWFGPGNAVSYARIVPGTIMLGRVALI